MFSFHTIKNIGLLVLVAIQIVMTIYAFRQLDQNEADLKFLSEELAYRLERINRIERTVDEAATLFYYDTADIFLGTESLSEVIGQAQALSGQLYQLNRVSSAADLLQNLTATLDRLDFAIYLYAEAERIASSDREIIARSIQDIFTVIFDNLLILQQQGLLANTQLNNNMVDGLGEVIHVADELFRQLEQNITRQPDFIVRMLAFIDDDLRWLEEHTLQINEQEPIAINLQAVKENLRLLKSNLPSIYRSWSLDPNMSHLKGDIDVLTQVWDGIQSSLNIIQLEEKINFEKRREEITGKAALNKIRFSALAVLGLMSALVLAIMLSRVLKHRLARLTTVLKRYAQGELDTRLPVSGDDDLSQLVMAFNDMAEQIQSKDRNVMELIDELVTNQAQLKEAHDQLERRVAERTSELSAANEKLVLMGKVFDHAREGILILDTTGTIIRANPEFYRMTGFDTTSVVGKRPAIFRQEEQDLFESEIQAELAREGAWEGELLLNEPDGRPLPVLASVSQYTYENDSIAGYIAILHDIRELKEKEELISYHAYHDILTGLPNRLLLSDRLEIAISQARRQGHSVGLLFLDLDNFKKINDSFGHVFGDELLKRVADILKDIFREVDTVSRIGGDEFIIVLSESQDRAQVHKLAQRVLQEISRAHIIRERKVHTTVSIGIATYPENGSTVDELLKNADIAMYSAKEHGKNTIQAFTRSMDEETQQRLALEEALWKALSNREFELYYQPQLTADGQQVTGVECLVRWNHPVRGLVSPLEFITVCEETGQILPLGKWVLEEACRFAGRLQARYELDDFRVFVNVSPKQFSDKSFLETIINTLTNSDFDPGLLGVEITETSMMVDIDYTRNVLDYLNEKGLSIAIDDFGTGYSSLMQLKNFPIRKLKIDRSFVADLPQNRNDGKLVETIIGMAHQLEIETVAEGVETLEQQQYLQQLGCNKVQGFLYSKPLPEELFIDYLEREHKLRPIPHPSAQDASVIHN